MASGPGYLVDVCAAAIALVLLWSLLMAGLSTNAKKTAFAHEMIRTILTFGIGVLTGRFGVGPH